MILDIIQTIINWSKLNDQLKCSMIDKYMYNHINIYKLNVPKNMTRDIFMQKKYSKLKILLCNGNHDLCNITHLSNTLIELNCSGRYSKINQHNISELKILEKLECPSNINITNVNHLKKTLKFLDCGGNMCGIDQYGISELESLEELYCSSNDKINNVNHLRNTLTKLYCSGEECEFVKKEYQI